MDQPEVALDMITAFLDDDARDAPPRPAAGCSDTCDARRHRGGHA